MAQLTRCATLLLVSVGDGEAKVEDVMDNLCVLTHQRDHLEDMGGKVVKGVRDDEKYIDSDDDFAYRKSLSFLVSDAGASMMGAGRSYLYIYVYTSP